MTEPFEGALVGSLEPDELWRALEVAAEAFLCEVRETEPESAARLEAPLGELARR